MPTRKQLQQEIAELDTEINQILERVKAPDIRMRTSAFPSGNWGIFILCSAWWMFGDMVSADMYFRSETIIFYMALIFGAMALLRTLVWTLRRGSPEMPPEYREATERVKLLQDKRRELQKQMKELDA